MNVSKLTAVFLVLLRLSIGWHLLYEGIWKHKQGDRWTSMGYLYGGTGPLALPTRWLAGDPAVSRDGLTFTEAEDADPARAVLERYTPRPVPPGEEKPRWHRYMPDAVEKQWDEYFQAYVKHYQLDQPDARPEKAVAERTFQESKNKFVEWLREGKKAVAKTAGAASVSVTRTIPERVQDYLNKLKEVQDLREKQLAPFAAGAKEKLDQAVVAARAQRKALLDDLDEQTAKMKQDLRELLSWEQRHMPAVPEPAAAKPAEWKNLKQLDAAVRWGLVVIGLGLLLGLFTRLSCLAGALLLLTFYLVQPAPPLSPEDPAARSHYLFIDTNLIEGVALLLLATTRSGRWFGLDGWLQFLWPRRRDRDEAEDKLLNDRLARAGMEPARR
jgi:uncharacterized membrane protein YphA (DoxX/SURF4 family)